MVEDLMYLLSLVESIIAGAFGVIALIVALVALIVIVVIALAFEIVMLPVSLIAWLIYVLAGVGNMDWWNNIVLFFSEAGASIWSFIQGIF
jgi:hypothetical protein